MKLQLMNALYYMSYYFKQNPCFVIAYELFLSPISLLVSLLFSWLATDESHFADMEHEAGQVCS
jgi:hypothetical protein